MDKEQKEYIIQKFKELEAKQHAKQKAFEHDAYMWRRYYHNNRYTLQPRGELLKFKKDIIKSGRSERALAYLMSSQDPMVEYWETRTKEWRTTIMEYPERLYENREFADWEQVIIKNGTYLEMLEAAKCSGTNIVALLMAAYEKAEGINKKEDFEKDFNTVYNARYNSEGELYKLQYKSFSTIVTKMKQVSEFILKQIEKKEQEKAQKPEENKK